MPAQQQLVRYDAMCSAIAAAYKVDEVKNIRDKALALEVYARQALNVEAERQACEIRLRAERKAGQLLKQRKKNKGGGDRRSDHRSKGATGDASTLSDLGISKDQSSQWQRLAEAPEDKFEEALATSHMPSTAGILHRIEEPPAASPAVTPVSKDALRLWGRLQDFEREGWLSRTPAEVMETMTEEMLDDVHTLAPRVAAWLRLIGAD
jgi:hypothetical protein